MGNFWGRKLSWIGEKYKFCGENSQIANTIFVEKTHRLLTFAALKDTTLPNFKEKSFANSHKTAKFAKIFSLESFPLYNIVWTKLEFSSHLCSDDETLHRFQSTGVFWADSRWTSDQGFASRMSADPGTDVPLHHVTRLLILIDW